MHSKFTDFIQNIPFLPARTYCTQFFTSGQFFNRAVLDLIFSDVTLRLSMFIGLYGLISHLM